jgi:hypothetical protein
LSRLKVEQQQQQQQLHIKEGIFIAIPVQQPTTTNEIALLTTSYRHGFASAFQA